ncbi:nuclear transport factor 2 family protein [Thermodesulfobacteriota bacterium]
MDTETVVRNFMSDLDRNDIDAVAGWFSERATWWVDTGLDRAAGIHGHDSGKSRHWPLHGTMKVSEKLPKMHGMEKYWPEGLRQRVSRIFSDGHWALAEVEGYGVNYKGRLYQNRYAFVVEVRDQKIETIHEYLDTLHALDIFQAVQGQRTTMPKPVAPDLPVMAKNSEEEVALQLFRRVYAADIEAIEGLFAPTATWWTDTGTNRDAGKQDREAEPGHSWSLHGTLPIARKLKSMRGMKLAFPEGLLVIPIRCFSSPPLVALETYGHADHTSGRPYQNRYVWVMEIKNDKIQALREYNDTLHVVDIFGA